MPWKLTDALRHTKKARTPKLQRQWRDVANHALQRGLGDAAAIREANAVVARNAAPKTARKKRKAS
jgi:hypothetical protein